MGIWLDLLLLALVAALALLLYRMGRERPAPRLRDPEAEGEAAAAVAAEPRGFPRYLHRWARQAGLDPGALVAPWWLAKILLAALLPLLAVEAAARAPFFAMPVPWLVLLAAAGFLLPDLWLLLRRRARVRRIRIALSYFLDLVVSLLHSGLGLDEAFRRAGRQGLDPDHPLAKEVALVDNELEIGKERSLAFDALAARTGIREFRGVAAALRLGLRLGNSVQATLDAQADLLRLKRREAARRQISLAPLKTLLPILLCGFPLFAVLVIFPALAEILALLREIGALF